MLSLLALPTEMCLRHRFETRLRDWLFANGTYTIGAVIDPSERVLDCSEEPHIGLMQEDLKVRFRSAFAWSMRSPCQPPPDGVGLSAPVMLIDNSRFLASNIRLYRSEFFAFIGEPEVLGPEGLGIWAISYTHGKAR